MNSSVTKKVQIEIQFYFEFHENVFYITVFIPLLTMPQKEPEKRKNSLYCIL